MMDLFYSDSESSNESSDSESENGRDFGRESSHKIRRSFPLNFFGRKAIRKPSFPII